MSNIMRHLQKIAQEIGERPAGTQANKQAGDYIYCTLEASKLEVETLTADFPNWACTSATLTLNGEALVIDANPFSVSCNMTAPIAPVCTLPELEAANLKDKIVLLYGELSSAPIFPMGFTIYNPDRDKTINRLLLEKNPLAILAINPSPFRQQHIIEDDDMPIASATITAEAGLHLLKCPDATVQLHIETQKAPDIATTYIARQASRNPYRVILCAHYDTKFGTSGAHDNASGVAALLTLVEQFAERELAVDLEFIVWGDEEYGGRTDAAYIKQFEFDDIACVINLDGIGQYTATNTITMLAESEAFQQQVKAIAANYPAIQWVAPWFASNHYTFFANGVPCIPFGSIGTNTLHQVNDTIEWMSAEKLAEVIALVSDLLEEIQHNSATWTRTNQY